MQIRGRKNISVTVLHVLIVCKKLWQVIERSQRETRGKVQLKLDRLIHNFMECVTPIKSNEMHHKNCSKHDMNTK